VFTAECTCNRIEQFAADRIYTCLNLKLKIWSCHSDCDKKIFSLHQNHRLLFESSVCTHHQGTMSWMTTFVPFIEDGCLYSLSCCFRDLK
jgi:hypothetical protein